MNVEEKTKEKFKVIKAKRWALPVAIITVGVLAAIILTSLRPSPAKQPAQKVAALVSTMDLERSEYPVILKGFGTVIPKRELDIRPQVSGHITKQSDSLQLGGRITQGDLLFEIDPSDYKIALEAQRANVARAEFELELEEGNQIVAKKEWELLSQDSDLALTPSKLVLREPQLKEKKAALKAAQSQLERAQLDLNRTSIHAPFPAIVLEESVEVGEFVSPQSSYVRLAATDEFHVNIKISQKDLRWLNTVGTQQKPTVSVIQKLENREITYNGELIRILGSVDESGRMAQVLAAIKNPLKAESERPPLLLGSFVRVEIKSTIAKQAIKLPRAALREGEVIWYLDAESKLAINKVETLFAHKDYVYVSSSLPEATKIITSQIISALEGMLIEIDSPQTLENIQENSGEKDDA